MSSLLKENYKELRYRADCFKVNLISKWYSTSRNPRVICCRIGDGPLLSLRTFQREPFQIDETNKFLVVEKVSDDDIIDRGKFEDPFGSPETKKITEFELLQHDNGALVTTPEGFSQPSLRVKLLVKLQQLRKNSDYHERREAAKIEPFKEELGLLETKEVRLDSKENSFQDKNVEIDRIEEAVDNPSSDPDPQIESIESPREEEISPSYPKLPARPLSGPISELPVSRNSNNQLGAWRSVLSGISVSAARHSTGHSAATSKDFKVLSGDFIHAELWDNNDINKNKLNVVNGNQLQDCGNKVQEKWEQGYKKSYELQMQFLDEDNEEQIFDFENDSESEITIEDDSSYDSMIQYYYV